MAQKEVIIYTCDNCPTEAEPESSSWKTPLPKGWVDMNIVANEGVLVSKHLCPDCLSVAIKALLRRNTAVGKKK